MPLNADAFSIYLIPPVLSFVFGGYLAILALSAARGTQRRTMVIFAVVCVWYSLLAPVFILHHLIADPAVILSIERSVHFFYVYLPLVLVAFFHRLLDIHRPKVLWACFAASFLISLSTHSEAYFSGLYKFSWGYIAKGGIAFELFALYGLVAMAYSIYCFISRWKSEANPVLRLRFKYVAFSFGVATGLTLFNIPAMHGIDFYPAGNFTFLPLAILAYALLRHRLVEIKSLVHVTVLRVVIFLVIMVPNFLLFRWVEPYLHSRSGEVQFVLLSAWVLFNYLYFIPMWGLLRRWAFRSREQLREAETPLIKEMLVLQDAQALVRKAGDAITGVLPFHWVHLFVHDVDAKALIGPDGASYPLSAQLASRLPQAEGIIERAFMEELSPLAPVQAPLKALMRELKAAYVVPLVHNDMLTGLLAMPKKSTLQPLYPEEDDFIGNISKSLALALSNALMYQRIASLKDNLQTRTEALTVEVGERKRVEQSLKGVQRELQETNTAMEHAILQANEMTAKVEIANHVLTKEMEERKEIENALRKSEEMYRLITENSTDVIWTIDMEGRFTFISPSVLYLLGYSPQEMLALHISAVLTPESLETATRAIAEEQERLRRPGSPSSQSRTTELEQVRKSGSTVWTEVNTRFIRDENRKIMGILGVTRDITERRKSEQDLIYMAHHDALTGLPNRKAFIELLEKEIKYASRYDTGLGLMFFDLDRFKQVNDTFGHEIGDQLLKAVAERLSVVVRETDIVARLGGDEFTIILKNPEAVCPDIVARRIVEELSKPFVFGNIFVDFVSASIGIATFPKDGASVGSLMKSADIAMYEAKKGAGDWIYYSGSLKQAV